MVESFLNTILRFTLLACAFPRSQYLISPLQDVAVVTKQFFAPPFLQKHFPWCDSIVCDATLIMVQAFDTLTHLFIVCDMCKVAPGLWRVFSVVAVIWTVHSVTCQATKKSTATLFVEFFKSIIVSESYTFFLSRIRQQEQAMANCSEHKASDFRGAHMLMVFRVSMDQSHPARKAAQQLSARNLTTWQIWYVLITTVIAIIFPLTFSIMIIIIIFNITTTTNI